MESEINLQSERMIDESPDEKIQQTRSFRPDRFWIIIKYAITILPLVIFFTVPNYWIGTAIITDIPNPSPVDKFMFVLVGFLIMIVVVLCIAFICMTMYGVWLFLQYVYNFVFPVNDINDENV
jgi:hypothetical protein